MKLHTIHLILMDIMMPNMDGIRATLNIREENNIPIILLSAKSQERDKIEGLEVGADDYITIVTDRRIGISSSSEFAKNFLFPVFGLINCINFCTISLNINIVLINVIMSSKEAYHV